MHFSFFIYSLTALSLGALAAPKMDPKVEAVNREGNIACFKDWDTFDKGGASDQAATEAACDSAMAQCGKGTKYIGYDASIGGYRICTFDSKACPHAEKTMENICRKKFHMVSSMLSTVEPPKKKAEGGEGN